MEKKPDLNGDKAYIVPSYMKNFRCIGGDCEDTCCAGWYIEVDEKTYRYYKKVKHPTFSKRLKKELVEKKGGSSEYAAKIKLKNGRCAFLNTEGLCDVYATLGEKALCNTCTMYPRTVNHIGQNIEYSLAVSCPEAARHILSQKQSITFEVHPEMPKYDREIVYTCIPLHSQRPKKWQDYFLEIRQVLMTLMQQPNYTIEARLVMVTDFLTRLSEYCMPTHYKQLSKFLKTYQSPTTKFLNEQLILEKKRQLAALKPMFDSLQSLLASKKLKGERYTLCFEKIKHTVLKTPELLNPINEVAYETLQRAVFENYPTIFENYWVNYFFSGCVPLDQKTPIESLKRIKQFKDLQFFHFYFLSQEKTLPTPQTVIATMQLLAKCFEHHESLLKELEN
jgi:lysine-N-methylase